MILLLEKFPVKKPKQNHDWCWVFANQSYQYGIMHKECIIKIWEKYEKNMRKIWEKYEKISRTTHKYLISERIYIMHWQLG